MKKIAFWIAAYFSICTAAGAQPFGLLGPGPFNGFPITIGSTVIVAGSTTSSISGLSLVTPSLGVATGTSLALGGCTIGANALCTTGGMNATGAITTASVIKANRIATSGIRSQSAWTTSGVRVVALGAVYTDTTSSGTVPAAYIDSWAGVSVAASSVTTYSDFYTAYVGDTAASTNVTFTREFALGADSASVGTAFRLSAPGNDGGLTDASLCRDTTSGLVKTGTGAGGLCLGTSSRRFKTGIQPLTVGLDEIMKLKPVSFYLDKTHGDPKKQVYGFIAEDAISALPKLVGKDSVGRVNTFDYVGVIPVLVMAIQAQQSEIGLLKHQISLLRRRK